ncbi:laccase-4-like, partial [Anneissia japonica]
MEDELSTSIHWHGQYQYGTNWMDGVGMVTQCPIKNGPLFVYEFVANPAGTQLWYDMSGLSQSDGLFGSLIVRQPIEEEAEVISKAYDYDLAEHVIVMSDWSTIDGLETFTTAYAPAKVVRDHTINILINGKAQGAEFIDAFGRSAYTPRETFGVVKGNRYRMRIMNAAATSCNIAVYVESHSLKVIAADGSLVDPVDVDYLIISPGE